MKINGRNGLHGELRVTEDGALCPVCGLLLENCIPWTSDGRMDYDGCPECDTEFGSDDYFGGRNNLNELWSRLRIAWLNRNKWPERVVTRIKDNLDIDRAELEEELKRYREDEEYLRWRPG